MKKAICFIALLSSVSLASCGLLDKAKSFISDMEALDSEDSEGENTGENTNTGTNTGDSGNTSGEEESPDTIRNNLKQLATSKGFAVEYKTYETDPSDYMTRAKVGRKGDVSWYLDGQETYGTAYKADDTYVYTFNYNSDTQSWDYSDKTQHNGDKEYYLESVYNFMCSTYFRETDSIHKTGTATIAGRTCDVFEGTTKVYGYTVNIKGWQDQKTKASLKAYSKSSYSGEELEGTTEVTSFTEGVTAPTLTVTA